MREVVRGDKHNLRKSANRNAQVSVIHSAYCTDLCFAICRFSQVVFVTSNNFTHNLLFLFPIVFSISLIPFFDILLSNLLAVFQPSCSGMCYFCATSLGPLRGRNSCCLWFWQLVFGVWLRDATSNLPSSPNPSLKQKCAPRSRLEKAYMRKHTYK